MPQNQTVFAFCLKFVFLWLLISLLLNMFCSGVDDSYIHCVFEGKKKEKRKKKVNLDHVVLV